MHFIPQTATFTPFSIPIPATSHFDKFGFKPENNENKEVVFSNSFIEPNFFKKKIVSSAKALYINRKVFPRIFRLLISYYS